MGRDGTGRDGTQRQSAGAEGSRGSILADAPKVRIWRLQASSTIYTKYINVSKLSAQVARWAHAHTHMHTHARAHGTGGPYAVAAPTRLGAHTVSARTPARARLGFP